MQALRSLVRYDPIEREWTPMALDDQDDPRSSRSAGTDLGSGMDPETAREAYDDDFNYDAVNNEGKPAEEETTPRKSYWCLWSRQAEETTGTELLLPLEPLTENIYGFAMASLIQDSADVRMHPTHCLHSLRPLRIMGAFTLSLVMFGMQCFFIFEAKKLITPHDVSTARRVYGHFEAIMYLDKDNVSHTWNTSNGYPRGYDDFYNASNFDKLSHADKALVCRVPLSQPHFLFGVLFIWTLTVLAHMRTTFNLCIRILMLPNLVSMEGALRTRDNADEVVGLTPCLKFVLIMGVQFPRIVMNSILLWLGARWLIATLGFGDLFLNALALEFILNLSFLLYDAMVPYNAKLLVQRTLIPHVSKHESQNCCNMFGMFLIGLLAASLDTFYMCYFQGVLPGYKFDVSPVCRIFLEEELAL